MVITTRSVNNKPPRVSLNLNYQLSTLNSPSFSRQRYNEFLAVGAISSEVLSHFNHPRPLLTKIHQWLPAFQHLFTQFLCQQPCWHKVWQEWQNGNRTWRAMCPGQTAPCSFLIQVDCLCVLTLMEVDSV